MADITWLGADATSPTDFDTSTNWEGGVVPGAGDTLIFSPDYNNPLTTNMDHGTTAFSEIIVRSGYSSDIGTNASPLKGSFSKFQYHGSGKIWVDFSDASGIDPVVTKSAPFNQGKYSVNMKGNIDVLTVSGGSVAVAPGQGDAATIATLTVSGGRVDASSRVTSLTTINQSGGKVFTHCDVGTAKVMSGDFYTFDAAAITTSLTQFGGVSRLNGSGTVTLLSLHDNALSVFTENGVPRTITTLTQNGGNIMYDPSVITIGTDTSPNRPVLRSISNV